MNELTQRMWEYRQCLKTIWNSYLAEDGDWDDRVYFSNAAVELFRAIVLNVFEDNDRNAVIFPSYNSVSQKPFRLIRVRFDNLDNIRNSKSVGFEDEEYFDSNTPLESLDVRYIDLFDFGGLGLRGFDYVLAEVVASAVADQVGMRILVPFENSWFEPTRVDTD